jgi:hypothetical protein
VGYGENRIEAGESSFEPTAKTCSLREELAQNSGVLRWPCGRFEQSDAGEWLWRRNGGESVSQSPLKTKAFSISPDQNPPCIYGRKPAFRFQSSYGIDRGSSKYWPTRQFSSVVDSRVDWRFPCEGTCPAGWCEKRGRKAIVLKWLGRATRWGSLSCKTA